MFSCSYNFVRVVSQQLHPSVERWAWKIKSKSFLQTSLGYINWLKWVFFPFLSVFSHRELHCVLMCFMTGSLLDFPQFYSTINLAPNIYSTILLLINVCIYTAAIVTQVWLCVCIEPGESRPCSNNVRSNQRFFKPYYCFHCKTLLEVMRARWLRLRLQQEKHMMDGGNKHYYFFPFQS